MESSERVIETSLYELRRFTTADFAALALAEEGERVIRWCYASGSRNGRYKRIVLRNGKGVVGTVMRSGRPLILHAFAPQKGDQPSDYPIMLSENLHSMVAYPITMKEHVIGVLLIGNRYEHHYDAETVEMIGNFAEQLGAMMQAQTENRARPFERAPVLVHWEVTRACEQNCLYCRKKAEKPVQPECAGRELTTAECFQVMEQLKSFGEPTVVLTGSDPVLRPDLFDLIAYGKHLGLNLALAPCATEHLSKNVLQQAQEAGVSHWVFSIDGSSSRVHDPYRGGKGSFARTLEAIKNLHEFKMPVQINTTVSRYNLHDLHKIAKLVSRTKAVLWNVQFLVPTGREKLDDMISPEQHEQVFQWLHELAKKMPCAIEIGAAPHHRRVAIQRRMSEGEPLVGEQPSGTWLNDGNGMLYITYTGNVQPSAALPLVAGNIREKTLGELYRNAPLFTALRNPDGFRGKCGICPYRRICGGSRARAYAVTGDFLASEPFCTFMPLKTSNQ